MSGLRFSCRAPDAKTFWQSWVGLGIATAPYEFAPGFADIQITDGVLHGWVVTRQTGQIDKNGAPVLEAVPGYHANFQIGGALAEELSHALDQTDEEGNIKNLMDRTWFPDLFQLVWKEADAKSKFPAGYCDPSGVTYCDAADIKTPANVWA